MKLNFYILLISIIFTGALQAEDEIKIHTEVATESIFMGEAFIFNILVSGSDEVKAPDTIKFSNFSHKLLNSTPVSEGDKKGYIIRYQLMALTSGNLTIKPISFQVKGIDHSSQELKVKVQKPASHEGLKLAIHLSQKEAYVGQPITATFTWYTNLPLYAFRAVDLKIPLLEHRSFKNLTPRDSAKPGSNNSIGLPVSNTRIIAKRGREKIGEVEFEFLRFNKIIIPTETGKIKIAAPRLLCSFVEPPLKTIKTHRNRHWKPIYPSFFNNDFFDKKVDEKYLKFLTEGTPLEIDVLPLPIAGQPKDFYGIVGKCEISTSCDKEETEAGSPISLKVTFSQHPYPEVLEMPALARQLPFKQNFAIPAQGSLGYIKNGQKTFSQSLRPLRAGVTAIPAVRVPYFDPQTKKYGVATSEPLTIKVTEAQKITAFDADFSADTQLKNKIEENPEGIRHNNMSMDILASEKISNLWLLTLIIPPLAFAFFYLLTARQRLLMNDPAKAHARFAFKNFKAAITNGKTRSDIKKLENVLRTYFSTKLNISAEAHTGAELQQMLQEKLSSADLEQISSIYTAFDTQRYSTKSCDTDIVQLQQQISLFIQTINKKISHV